MIPVEASNILQGFQIIVTLTVLWTFLRSRRNEAEERGARQEKLDGVLKNLQNAVTALTTLVAEQEKRVDKLSTILELLLQQHCFNHNQEIGGRL